MGVASALLVLCCALAALPVNLGAQQQLVVDAGRLQDALLALNVSSSSASATPVVFPTDTEPAEMLLKCKTTCTFDGPNMTHSSAASTCARCLDRTASDIIDRVIATQEQLTSFRIQTRADRALYSRREEAHLIAAHESAVLQLRNAVQPALPSTTGRNGTNFTAAGPSFISSSAVNVNGPSAAQATLLKTGESAKMKQTSGKLVGGASVAAVSTSAAESAAVSALASEASTFPSAASSLSSSSSLSSLSSSSSSPPSTVPYVFFSPRQECYRVCGDNGDISQDESPSSFVELGSQMLSEEFSSLGTLEQCIRL
jgi:hypothetical protein